MKIVSPSLLAANFMELEKELQMINESHAEWLHLDIMDGVFVPNISFGFPILEAVAKRCTKKLDVHFMIENPQKFIKETSKLGAMMMAVHYENCPNLCRTIDEIHEAGMKAGVMINPATPVRAIKDVITMTDMIGVMAVNPGFGGQKYIERTQEKVKELKMLIDNTGANTLIEVDGGVNDVIGKRLAEAGADVLVAGSYIFNAPNPLERIDSLYKL